MQTTTQQETNHIPEQKQSFKWKFWQKSNDTDLQKTQKLEYSEPSTGDLSFYEKAIEWTHRADKVINLVLGYLLAIASVLGFMDVLSNGEILGQVPYMFYAWLAIMGLGVDFQILLVIGRLPDLARTASSFWAKLLIFVFNIAFLAFLCYMSAVIGAVFTQHRDVPGTINQAMSTLGIDATYFVYERAALATLLLVLMGVDRTMERWRMQLQRVYRQKKPCDDAIPQTVQPSPQPHQPQTNDLEKLMQAMIAMNQQTLQSMQAMNQQAMQVTIEQVTRVTVEAVRETVAALPAFNPLQLPASRSEQQQSKEPVNGLPAYCSGEQDRESESKPVTGLPPYCSGEQGREQQQREEPLNGLPIYCSGEQEESEAGKTYGPLIEVLYRKNPQITVTEIVHDLQCSRSTAAKWLARVKPKTSAQ